jgi:hypothetical protein
MRSALGIEPIRGVYSTKDTFCSIYITNGGRWSWLSEQTGVAIQTLKRHYARYERTAEDDATELARLRQAVKPMQGSAKAGTICPTEKGTRAQARDLSMRK